MEATLLSLPTPHSQKGSMANLRPVSFDLETTGLKDDSVITVAGIGTELGSWLALNTSGRDVDAETLRTAVERESDANVQLSLQSDEAGLLSALQGKATDLLDPDRHYLTAYNGEVWRGGFDLPFLRSACASHDVPWPFPSVAYVDTMDVVERFHTGDVSGLVGVYEALIGDEHCDPFVDSQEAVTAHEDGDWTSLLLHNLADIKRTRELAVLGGRYVPRKDFGMKSLEPPDI